MLQEIFCVVEGGQNHAHPFRRVKDALSGDEDFVITPSRWTDRLVPTLGYSVPLTHYYM